MIEIHRPHTVTAIADRLSTGSIGTNQIALYPSFNTSHDNSVTGVARNEVPSYERIVWEGLKDAIQLIAKRHASRHICPDVVALHGCFSKQNSIAEITGNQVARGGARASDDVKTLYACKHAVTGVRY